MTPRLNLPIAFVTCASNLWMVWRQTFFILFNSTTNNIYKFNNGNEKWVHEGWKSSSIINHSFNVLFDLRWRTFTSFIWNVIKIKINMTKIKKEWILHTFHTLSQVGFQSMFIFGVIFNCMINWFHLLVLWTLKHSQIIVVVVYFQIIYLQHTSLLLNYHEPIYNANLIATVESKPTLINLVSFIITYPSFWVVIRLCRMIPQISPTSMTFFNIICILLIFFFAIIVFLMLLYFLHI